MQKRIQQSQGDENAALERGGQKVVTKNRAATSAKAPGFTTGESEEQQAWAEVEQAMNEADQSVRAAQEGRLA